MMFDGGEIPVFAASITVVAAFLLLRWIKENGVKEDGKRHPPSLPVLSVFSAILRGGLSVLPEHFMRAAERLGPVYSFRVGKRRVVVLNGYEAIYDAMVRHSEAFADRSPLWTEAKLLNHEFRDHSERVQRSYGIEILERSGELQTRKIPRRRQQDHQQPESHCIRIGKAFLHCRDSRSSDHLSLSHKSRPAFRYPTARGSEIY